jgi:glycosyltransferase involved in cell wall biosynthesis
MRLATIAIPTYKRPALLQRCLDKLAGALGSAAQHFEVIVGDDSAMDVNERLVADFARRCAIECRYVAHAAPLGQQGNFNDLICRARGRYIQFVHDDDYLLAGAGASLVEALSRQGDRPEPVLFGSQIVNLDGSVRRTEGVGRSGYLPPKEAVRTLLANSSYVRFPAMVVPAESYKSVGLFNPEDLVPDWPVWLRLVARYGLAQQDSVTNAYTIHDGAASTSTFQPQFMKYLNQLLREYQSVAAWSDESMNRAAGEFLYRYILAGCLRAAKQRQWENLAIRAQVLTDLDVADLPCPARWLPLKWAFRQTHLFLRTA